MQKAWRLVASYELPASSGEVVVLIRRELANLSDGALMIATSTCAVQRSWKLEAGSWKLVNGS
jgi:hypothetical protein